MSQFTVRGRYQTRGGYSDFETTVEAENEDVAHERTYANFGGRHGLKRTQVEISEVEAQ